MIFFNIIAGILIFGSLLCAHHEYSDGKQLSALISYELAVAILWMMDHLNRKTKRIKAEIDELTEKIETKQTPEEWEKDLNEKRSNFQRQDSQTDIKEQNDE